MSTNNHQVTPSIKHNEGIGEVSLTFQPSMFENIDQYSGLTRVHIQYMARSYIEYGSYLEHGPFYCIDCKCPVSICHTRCDACSKL